MTSKRNIVAIQLNDIEPSPAPTSPPELTWIDPRDLLVDETYQRNLSDRSLALIKRIIAGWDWRRFKVPNVAWTDDGLEVIDGQHTAIAAASRDDIQQIPVLVTSAAEQAERASAFIGLNRDRVAITATQLHAAAVAAGDEDALAIERVCRALDVTVLKHQRGAGKFQPRDTMAVAAIGSLVNRRPDGAEAMLRPLAEANLAPIQANHIKAAELLLTDAEFETVDAEAITRAILASGPDAGEQEAKLFAATHRVPLWRALAAVWFKRAPKKRKPSNVDAETRKAMPGLEDVKRDARPEKGTWRPGRYMRRCDACDQRFEGGLTAKSCADCAYSEDAPA